jgi:pimeloyl-ACP methyl ester carboxylesterase
MPQPAYPVIIVGGFLLDAGNYRSLAEKLKSHCSATVYTVPFTLGSWLAASGASSYANLLKMTHETVARALAETGAEKVNFVGHSAGGSVARLYMGDKDYDGVNFAGFERTASLVTLGCPHFSQLSYTRRTIDFINEQYPDAYYPDIVYAATVGRSVEGRIPGTFGEMFAFNNYRLTCGKGGVWGDGVVPVESCLLPGADNTVYEGVHHTPNRPHRWYDAEIDHWSQFLR